MKPVREDGCRMQQNDAKTVSERCIRRAYRDAQNR